MHHHHLPQRSLALLVAVSFLSAVQSFSEPRPLLHTSLTPQNPPPPPPIASPNVQSPRDFLAERSAGPYTCLRARDLNLLGFDFHIKRLMDSIRASGGSIDEKTLRHQVLDGIEENVQEAMKGQEGANKSPLDSFITIHADLKAAGSPKLSFHSLSMPYATMPPPITLEIRGEGRKNPEVKHSQWLWDRQELERFRIGPGGEVALSRQIGGRREVLEGLVTNVFAIQNGELITAQDGILKGHIREMVMESAKALGIPVHSRKEALRLEEIGTWDEVFITGSGRMLVPVNRIEGTTVGLMPPVDLQAPGPLTVQLRQRLLYDIDKAFKPIKELKARTAASSSASSSR